MHITASLEKLSRCSNKSCCRYFNIQINNDFFDNDDLKVIIFFSLNKQLIVELSHAVNCTKCTIATTKISYTRENAFPSLNNINS